jgi:hypothetical protein
MLGRGRVCSSPEVHAHKLLLRLNPGLLQSKHALPNITQILMRSLPPRRAITSLLVLSFVPLVLAQNAPHPVVRHATLRTRGESQVVIRQLKILGNKDSVEIEIDASDRITPQAQVLTGPDRLVVDFPDAVPAPELRSQSIYVGAVKDVRAGLFRSNPPTTRVVIDLDNPETYQLFPSGRTVMVKMSTAVSPANGAAIDLWREPAVQAVVASSAPATQPNATPDPPKPSLKVELANGLLSIKADRVTLAEILQAVQQRTRADISLAPGVDQEKVVFDFGPAPAQEVLARLLHGSKFNFLILNAANDPKKLDRVILTPRTDGGVTTLPPLQTADQASQPQPDVPPSNPTPQPLDPRFLPPQQPEMNAPPNPPDPQ